MLFQRENSDINNSTCLPFDAEDTVLIIIMFLHITVAK